MLGQEISQLKGGKNTGGREEMHLNKKGKEKAFKEMAKLKREYDM